MPRGDARRFTLAQAIANREHRAVGGLVLAVLLLCLKATYNGSFWRTAGPRYGQAGRLAQLVEHRLYTPAVTGSSPVPPTITESERIGIAIADFRFEIADSRFEIADWI